MISELKHYNAAVYSTPTKVFALMSNNFDYNDSLNIQEGSVIHRCASIIESHNQILCVKFPYNVELCEDFFVANDQHISSEYHQHHAKSPQLLVILDGIADWSSDCRTYLKSETHQSLYSAIAFILSTGNMSVLEKHYLELVYANQLQNNPPKLSQRYPIGIFSNKNDALRWLESRPSRNKIG
jgi:hypothetical protein